MTNERYNPFDKNFEVRGVFLDISKASDKVLHVGLFLNQTRMVFPEIS